MSATRHRLNELLDESGLPMLAPESLLKFDAYLQLMLRWNARINLTALRDEESVLSRHFVESIACAHHLPPGIESLLDFGSGIPIAICRPGLAVTLAESQNKKAAFLAEAVRQLGLRVKVVAGRGEDLQDWFDCVTLRAVDQMNQAVEASAHLVASGGWLAAMTTEPDLPMIQRAAGDRFRWLESKALPGSERRVLALGRREAA